MKKYSNIPLKERKRNADRVYRHEERLEEITMRKLDKELERCKRAVECKTDKEQQEAEAFARLKSLARGGE
jgi:hypothetical protein